MTDRSSKKRILVTGGCGYLGSLLIRELARLASGERLSIRVLDNMEFGSYRALMDLPDSADYEFFEGDILDPAAVRLALRGVESVIHLASLVGTPMGFENPTWTEQINHWGTARLVELCLVSGVHRFIYVSTYAVYGPGGPFDEDAACRPVGPYALSIRHAEESILAASPRGLQPTILRMGTLFGSAPAVRFQSVANRLAFLAGTGRPLTVFGQGEQKRPVIHVRDACAALVHVLSNDNVTRNRIFNVAAANASVIDLVDAIRQSNPDVQVRFTEQDVLTHLSFEVDGTMFRNVGRGWEPAYSISAGMRELLDHFRGFPSTSLLSPIIADIV
ncbi:MAG: SDR family oxidoreductase [Candidatus Schekmanbacteria bacterium]|nr:SDR family oxidoreductase [Candidatus Schekmanbacteria bacterium]